MTWLAIDPGPTESAFVLYTDGKVGDRGKMANATFRHAFFASSGAKAVAIEMIQSFGMAVGAEVFETCVWVGRFMETALGAGLVVRRVFRKDVKMHLCHSMRAKDPNIRAALIDRLGPPGTKRQQGPTYGIAGDCWSALAVAVTAADTIGET